jgi:hypothetical protein
MNRRTQQRAATGSEPAATPAPTASPTPQLDALTASQPDLVDRIFDYVLELVPAIAERKTEIKGALRDEFGAQEGYIRRRELDPSATARLVLALFNGRNKHEIARRLDISLSQVHRIIKQSGDNSGARQKLSQPSLEMRQARR